MGGGTSFMPEPSTEPPGDDASSPSESLEQKAARYKMIACPGVAKCFTEHAPSGNFVGRVSRAFDPNGKAGPLRTRPTPPTKVLNCLEEAWRDRTIPDFHGPPGELVCEYELEIENHGTMAGGHVTGSYVVAKLGQTGARM